MTKFSMTIVEEMLLSLAGAAGPSRERAAMPVPAAEFANAVVAFLRRQMNADGGFKGRGAASDLFYTVFGLQSLLGLQADVPPLFHSA